MQKLLLFLINKVFKLNLTSSDLAIIMSFIETLIGLFGSKQEAMIYTQELVRRTGAQEPAKAKLLYKTLSNILIEKENPK